MWVQQLKNGKKKFLEGLYTRIAFVLTANVSFTLRHFDVLVHQEYNLCRKGNGFKSLETFSSIVCVEINVLHLFIFTYVIYFTITYFNNLFWLTKSAVVMIDFDTGFFGALYSQERNISVIWREQLIKQEKRNQLQHRGICVLCLEVG